MQDADKSAAMRILAACIVPAYVSLPSLMPIIVLKKVNLSLEFGNYVTSPVSYAFYGVLLCNALGDVDAGTRFGKLAINIVNIWSLGLIKCSNYFVYASMINHWKNHAKENIPSYLTAIQAGLDFGDFQYGSYSANYLAIQSFLMRKNLVSMVEDYQRHYKDVMLKFKLRDAIVFYQLFHQVAVNLKGDAEDIFTLKGTAFDESITVNVWFEAKDAGSLVCYFSNKGILFYIFESPKQAYVFFKQAEPYEAAIFGMMVVPEYNFFYSLSCLALLESPDSTDEDKKTYSEQIAKNQERMKVWGENCPANYGHKYYIVEAERARLAGNDDEALEFYDKAISLAKEHEYLLEEAIANELAAKYWFALKKDAFAKAHIIEAHYAYQRWGCKPKLAMMEKEYGYLK